MKFLIILALMLLAGSAVANEWLENPDVLKITFIDPYGDAHIFMCFQEDGRWIVDYASDYGEDLVEFKGNETGNVRIAYHA